MLLKLSAAVLLIIASAIFIDAAPPFTGPYPLRSADHERPMISRDLTFRKQTRDVLFIGNSFTFFGDAPAQLVNLASSDGESPLRLRVSAVTASDASLAQDWRRGDALRMLASRHFDFVVLQEQSGWPFFPADRASTYAAASLWANTIRAAGATPLLMETWSDRADSDAYRAGWWSQGYTPETAQARIAEATQQLGDSQSIRVLHVGSRLRDIAASPGAPAMYSADGHHPSEAGAWISALTIYQIVTGRGVTDPGYHPASVSEEGRRIALTRLATLP